MLLDLSGLPTQHIPEPGGLLALPQERDLCLPFPLILVHFLCKEPEDRCEPLSKAMLFLGDACLRPQYSRRPTYLALVVLLSVAWAPRHT